MSAGKKSNSRFVSWLLSVERGIITVEGGITVDRKRSGEFLKSLRKEKALTQEQLAEQFGVSARTVSRWETGSNMPDLAVLIFFCALLTETNAFGGMIPDKACHNILSFALGITLAALCLNIMYLLGVFERMSTCRKNRRRNKI